MGPGVAVAALAVLGWTGTDAATEGAAVLGAAVGAGGDAAAAFDSVGAFAVVVVVVAAPAAAGAGLLVAVGVAEDTAVAELGGLLGCFAAAGAALGVAAVLAVADDTATGAGGAAAGGAVTLSVLTGAGAATGAPAGGIGRAKTASWPFLPVHRSSVGLAPTIALNELVPLGVAGRVAESRR